MATINIRDTILDGHMGDGWNDQYAVALALAEYQQSVWKKDLADLVAEGHDVEIDIRVQRHASGVCADTQIEIEGLDDQYQFRQRITALLTDGQDVWASFVESDEASEYVAE